MAILMKAAKMPVWPTIGNGLLAGCAMRLVNGLLVSLARLPLFIATCPSRMLGGEGSSPARSSAA